MKARARAAARAGARSLSAGISWASRSPASGSRRRRIAVRRTRSTSSKSSGPSCSTMTWPSSAPRSLTSRRRAASARFGEDRPGAVVRTLRAFDDAAARVAPVLPAEVEPAVLSVALLEPAAAGDAGDRRKSSVTHRVSGQVKYGIHGTQSGPTGGRCRRRDGARWVAIRL